MALRMSAETGAAVFLDNPSNFRFCSSSSHIVVRFIASPCMPSGILCQSVRKLYPIRATLAAGATGATSKINNLRVLNAGDGFESHPLRHSVCTIQFSTVSNEDCGDFSPKWMPHQAEPGFRENTLHCHQSRIERFSPYLSFRGPVSILIACKRTLFGARLRKFPFSAVSSR
jgi:hypothetical protein